MLRKWRGKGGEENVMGGLREEGSGKMGGETRTTVKDRSWRLLIENAVREK